MPTLRPRRVQPTCAQPRTQPQLGHVIEVFWEDRDQVFRASVQQLDLDTANHLLVYEDGDVLWHHLDDYFWRPMGDGQWVVPFSGGKRENKESIPQPRPRRRRRVVTEDSQSLYHQTYQHVHPQKQPCQDKPAQSSTRDLTVDSQQVAESLSQVDRHMSAFVRKDSYARSEARTEQSFSELLSPTTRTSEPSEPNTPTLHLTKAYVNPNATKKRKFEGLHPSLIPPRKRMALVP